MWAHLLPWLERPEALDSFLLLLLLVLGPGSSPALPAVRLPVEQVECVARSFSWSLGSEAWWELSRYLPPAQVDVSLELLETKPCFLTELLRYYKRVQLLTLTLGHRFSSSCLWPSDVWCGVRFLPDNRAWTFLNQHDHRNQRMCVWCLCWPDNHGKRKTRSPIIPLKPLQELWCLCAAEPFFLSFSLFLRSCAVLVHEPRRRCPHTSSEICNYLADCATTWLLL